MRPPFPPVSGVKASCAGTLPAADPGSLPFQVPCAWEPCLRRRWRSGSTLGTGDGSRPSVVSQQKTPVHFESLWLGCCASVADTSASSPGSGSRPTHRPEGAQESAGLLVAGFSTLRIVEHPAATPHGGSPTRRRWRSSPTAGPSAGPLSRFSSVFMVRCGPGSDGRVPNPGGREGRSAPVRGRCASRFPGGAPFQQAPIYHTELWGQAPIRKFPRKPRPVPVPAPTCLAGHQEARHPTGPARHHGPPSPPEPHRFLRQPRPPRPRYAGGVTTNAPAQKNTGTSLHRPPARRADGRRSGCVTRGFESPGRRHNAKRPAPQRRGRPSHRWKLWRRGSEYPTGYRGCEVRVALWSRTALSWFRR